MAKELTRKEKQITQLYFETILEVGKNADNWITFLKRASYNYKYRFDEQLLIYAQRPDAIACAETIIWNKKLKRWINKGSKGIALITEKQGELGLRFVFDITDTNSDVYDKKFKLWKAEEKYANDIIEALEDKFGIMEDKRDLPFAIISTVYNRVVENMQDYLEELKTVIKNSELEKLNDKQIEGTFIEILMHSTIAVTMTRCGIDVNDYIQKEGFSGIEKFNTFETMSILGTATRDFSKEILLEISKTVINVQKQEKKQSYTFEKMQQNSYSKENEKGCVENEYNLYRERELFNTKLNNREEMQQKETRKVRQNEIILPKTEQERDLHNVNREQSINRTLTTNTGNSEKENITDSETNATGIWNNRGNESEKSTGMGRADEQYSRGSRTNSSEGTNLQLENIVTEKEVEDTSFFDEELIKNILKNAPNVVKNEREFIDFIYDNHQDKEKCKAYIKDVLGNAYTEFEIYGKRVGYKVNEDNLNIWTGNYLNRTEECFENWNLITEYCISNIVHYTTPEYNQDIYTFKVGDTIYLGLQEFIVLDLDNGKMIMYDAHFPLEQITVVIKDIIKKIAKNPMNDYLKDRPRPEGEKKEQQENVAQNIVKKSRNIEYFDLHPEIPTEKRNNFKITDDNLGVGTEKEKFRNNVNAIKTLKLCEEQNRYATTEEQEVLSKYVGWGGLKSAFEDNNDKWASEYAQLKQLLTEEEYKNARASSVTAYYTPPIVIKNIYKALQNMGLKQANILEPSCGVGNFLGMLPEELNNCKMYGVEIDSISGRIAGQLYQKSTIAIQAYEKTNMPDNFFDVAIGNVPFDNKIKPNDRRYNKNKFVLHDYFFAKTLDKVRPGGIIAFVTSKGTMDKENNSVRKYISQRAELIGAIRLPDNTFKSNAGTEVTSDIILLKKRDNITDIEEDWINLDTTENGIKMNKYFVDNPNMIMGMMTKESSQYGGEQTVCKMVEGSDLDYMLSNAILNLKSEIAEYDLDELIEDEEKFIQADPTVKNYSYTVIEGKVYYRENSRMFEKDLPETTINRIKGMVEIRNSTRKLIELQVDDSNDNEIKEEQERLNRLYDNFVKKYGRINSRGNEQAFSEDSSYYLLCSLEILDAKGNFVRKADMFSKKTIKAKKEITKVDTANEALIVSLTEKAKVDIEYMQAITDKTEEQLVKELEGQIFRIPDIPTEERKYVTADEYLSGNVRQKLNIAKKVAEGNPEFEVNVRELEKVIPEDIKASEISVKLGATWIPTEYIQQFIYELLDTDYWDKKKIKVYYSEYTASWNITGKSVDRGVKATNTYGVKKASAYKIIETTLNLNDIKIYKKITDIETGEEKSVIDKQETAIAQAKQDEIKMKFEEWIFKDADRREKLVKIYNEKFNSIRNRQYDGSYIKFYGMNPEIKLREHQVNAIARILYNGNTLLAHEVGAGKTFEMVAAAMESKRLGLCNKSIFVVPNHIVEQFSNEFMRTIPIS